MPDNITGNAAASSAVQTTTPGTQPTAAGSLAVEGTAKALELTHTFTDFEETERTISYHFRRPMRPQISRAVSGIRKDAMLALRTLCLDCVVTDEKERLKADLDAYDGLGSTFGNEILGRVGFGELGK
jgi:hypothetical protein